MVDWRWSDTVVPVLAGVLGAILVTTWLSSSQHDAFTLRVPGMDRPSGGAEDADAGRVAPEAGEPVAGPGLPSQHAGSWPWFRGPAWDGISREDVRLRRDWPEGGPPVLWSLTLGEGYAGAAVGDGRAYVLDYDEQAEADTLRCLSLDDGQEIWHNSYPVELTRNHGLSRTTPALSAGRVITIGPRCHVACWDATSGACHWLIDLVLEYGTEVPRWYAGQCPLVDGDRLILAPGGKSLVVAVDLETGRPIWETPNPQGWKMTHASVMPMLYGDRRMYVYCASGGVVGVSADDGTVLWQSSQWVEQFALAPSPVILPEGMILLSSGYDNKVGSLMLQVHPGPAAFEVQSLFTLAPKEFNSEQQTPIFHEGHLFGVRKHGGGRLVCLDPQGQQVWDSGKDRFGHGPYLIADGVVLVLSNDGLLTMAEASTTEYRPLARFQVFEDGHDAWGPMALAGGRLIVRDMTRMTCLDLAQSASPTGLAMRSHAGKAYLWDDSNRVENARE